jgi:hypothetical protein
LSSWSGIVNIDLVNSYFSKEVLSNAINEVRVLDCSILDRIVCTLIQRILHNIVYSSTP